MEQLTLEQAAAAHGRRSCVTHTELNRTAQEIDTIAFQAGAEWQKEQLKTHMHEVVNTLENDFAKQLVSNVVNILFA